MAANCTSFPSSAEVLRARYTPSAPYHYAYQLQTSDVSLLSPIQQEKPTNSNRPGKLHQQFSQRLQHPSSRFAIRPVPLDDFPPSAAAVQHLADKALAARVAAAADRQRARRQQQQQAESSWSANLASDIRAICEELRLSPAAAEALTAAALKRHVSANPGVLLCQLARLLPLERAIGSEGSIGRLLSVLPTLARHDPTTLLQNLESARQALGTDSVATALRKQPQLITCSPFRLQTNLAKLQDLLGVGPAAAAAAAADQPMLLLASPKSLQQRLDVLRNTLFAAVPEAVLMKHLRCTPELLLLRPGTVATKLQCLSKVFKSPGSTAANSAAPAVDARAASVGPAGGAQWQQQHNHRDRQQAWHEQQQQQQALQFCHLEGSLQLAAALARLKSAAAMRQGKAADVPRYARYRHWLQQQQQQQYEQPGYSSSSTDDACVQQLVLKVPGLLCLSPATLQLHVTELQLLLGLQPDDVALQRIIQLQPGLLTQAPATLANKLQLLQYLTGRSESEAQEMVLRCPAVLTLSVANITRKWELLSSCIACCEQWQQQLQKASHVTVAMAMCYNEKRLHRLQQVVQLYMEQGALGEHSSSQHSSSQHSSSRHSSSSSSDTADQFLEAIGAAAAAGVSSTTASSNSRSSGRGRKVRGKDTSACAAVLQVDAPAVGEQQQQRQVQKQRQRGLAAVPWRVIIQESDTAFQKRYAALAASWRRQ